MDWFGRCSRVGQDTADDILLVDGPSKEMEM